MTDHAAIQQVLDKHAITVTAEFVPFSKSRNAAEKNPSLNWRVTLWHDGRKLLTTDYMAGMAHCPAYKNARGLETSIWNMERIKAECEKGLPILGEGSVLPIYNKDRPILPDTQDVIYFLLLDGEAIDHTFEEWAAEFGYDTDFRKAEKIYNDCLQIGLKMRRIGESALAELREVYQDY